MIILNTAQLDYFIYIIDTILYDIKSNTSNFLSEISCPVDSVGLGNCLPKPTFLSEIISCFSLCRQCFSNPVSDKNIFLITTMVTARKERGIRALFRDRKSTRLNSSHIH